MCRKDKVLLTSPISVTIGSDTYSLSRINQDNFSARYLAKAAGVEVTLDIRHSYEKSTPDGQYERHNIDLRKVEFDLTGASSPKTYQAYTVIRCKRGEVVTKIVDVLDALGTFATANGTQIVSWES